MLTVAGSIVWLVVLCTAFLTVSAFDLRPGEASLSTANPDQLRLRLDQSKALLLVAAHPRCPCFRATLSELTKFTGRLKDGVELRALIFVPPGAGKDWRDTPTVQRLRELGFGITWDQDGKLAKQLGAETSGHILLYRKNSELSFSGGITAMRGHEGENFSETRFIAALNNLGDEPPTFTTPYGCALNNCRRGVN